MRKTFSFGIITLALLVLLTPTTYGQQGALNSPAIKPITLAVSPPTVVLQTGNNQTFTATVTGDVLNKGAVWTLSGAGCSGAACGTLSPAFNIAGTSQTISLSASSITYTAPPSVPSPAAVVLTATSVQDSTKFSSSTIALSANPPPVIPQNVTALTAQTAAATNTFPIAATVGNGEVVGVLTSGTTTAPSSVKDCLVGSSTCVGLTLVRSTTNSTSNTGLFVYTGIGIASGQGSIVTAEASPTGTVAIAYADLTNAASLDVTTGSSNQSGSNPSGPAATPTVSSDFALSFLATTGTVSAVTSPLTLSTGSAGFGFALSTTVLPNSSSITPSYTATSGNWESATILIKPGANSGAPISVSLSPLSPTLQTSGTQPFTCIVANDTAGAGCSITYSGTGCSGAGCGTGPSTATSGIAFTYTAPSSVPGSGGSAITRVQHKTASSEAFPVTLSITPSIGGSTDLLCGIVHWQTPETGSVTVTDSASQSYTDIINGTHTGSSSFDWRCVYGGVSGVTSITFSSASTARLIDVYAVEYTGILSGTPDQSTSQFLTSQTSMDSGFMASTTNASDLLIGTAENFSANTITAGTDGQGDPFTKLDSGSFVGTATQDCFPTPGTNTYKSIMTSDVAGNGFSAVVAFKGSSGGGSATPVMVTATSVTDPTKSVTATVTIQTASAPISVLISPTAASVQTGATQAFTPTIMHDSGSNTVNWTLSGSGCSGATCGTLSSATTGSGTSTTYTAPVALPSPAAVTITATDVTDSTKSASASIVLNGNVGPFVCNAPCPAFPASPGVGFAAASGGGAASVGGRGGVAIEVTNLNDSGTGSLRACISASGPRTCIFRVSGLITQLSRNAVVNPFLTIAGQTAPGGGIVLGGFNQSGEGLDVQTHDVIVRFLTYDGESVRTGPDIGTVGFEMANGGSTSVFNVVFDHLSNRWVGNKFLVYANDSSGSQHINSSTWQWILAYEPNIYHPVGPLMSSIAFPNENNDVDWHHNMFINTGHRIPLVMDFGRWRFVSNVTFNWDYFAAAEDGDAVDLINNLWLAGNLNVGNSNPHPLNVTAGGTAPDGTCLSNCDLSGVPSVYMNGNVGPQGTDYQLSAEEAGTDPEGFMETVSPIRSAWQRHTPFSAQTYPIPADSASSLPTLLPPTVGNSFHLNCDGSWASNRDSQDARVIAQFIARGTGGEYGQTTNPNPGPTALGYSPNYTGPVTNPPIPAGTPCTETLHDGIPDLWKTNHGLSTSDTGLAARTDPVTKITYLEDYLDGIVP